MLSLCGPRHEQWYPVAAGCTLHPCGGGKEGCLPCQGCTCGGREHPANARGGPVAAGRRDACTLNRGCPVAAAPTARGVPCGGGGGVCPLLKLAVCRPCGCVCGLSVQGRGGCFPCLVRAACFRLFGVRIQGKRALFLDLFNGLCNRPLCVTDRFQ